MNHKRKFFDSRAKNWDKEHDFENQKKIKELVLEFKIKKGAEILDIGCGTGVLLPHLSKNIGKDGKIFALDFSLEMLKKAKGKKIAKNITYINADVKELPFKNNFFDYITCFATFPHLDQKQSSLNQMGRVLKNNGKVFISHLASREEINSFHKQTNEVIANDLLPEERKMRKMMQKAGFINIKIIDKPSLYLACGEKG